MHSRREFLGKLSMMSGALMLDLRGILQSSLSTPYFALNEFIENNPDAVFILRTNVDSKTDASAIKEVGQQLSTTLFHAATEGGSGLPAATNVVIKPNITWWSWDQTPIEETMGIYTDPNFVEGMIGRLNELSIPSSNIFIREANYNGPDSVDGELYGELAARTNINLKNLYAGIGAISSTDVQ